MSGQASEERYEYRLGWKNAQLESWTPWARRVITADELAAWREDLPKRTVWAERRRVLYGEPERYEPS